VRLFGRMYLFSKMKASKFFAVTSAPGLASLGFEGVISVWLWTELRFCVEAACKFLGSGPNGKGLLNALDSVCRLSWEDF